MHPPSNVANYLIERALTQRSRLGSDAALAEDVPADNKQGERNSGNGAEAESPGPGWFSPACCGCKGRVAGRMLAEATEQRGRHPLGSPVEVSCHRRVMLQADEWHTVCICFHGALATPPLESGHQKSCKESNLPTCAPGWVNPQQLEKNGAKKKVENFLANFFIQQKKKEKKRKETTLLTFFFSLHDDIFVSRAVKHTVTIIYKQFFNYFFFFLLF